MRCPMVDTGLRGIGLPAQQVHLLTPATPAGEGPLRLLRSRARSGVAHRARMGRPGRGAFPRLGHPHSTRTTLTEAR